MTALSLTQRCMQEAEKWRKAAEKATKAGAQAQQEHLRTGVLGTAEDEAEEGVWGSKFGDFGMLG